MKRAHFLSVAEKGASHHLPFRQFMAKTPREGGGKGGREGESDLYGERRTYSAAPDRAEYLSH